MRALSLIPCAVIAFSMAVGTAAAVTVPLSAASSAAAFSMDVNLDGQKTSLGNQLPAVGSAPPSYNVKTAAPSYSKVLATPGGASVGVRAGSITSTAAAATPYPGAIQSVGQSAIGTFNTTVGVPVVGTLLSISAANVVSRAVFTKTRSGTRTAAGYANIGNVVVNAPLLGFNNKSFSGAPKVNQILYQSPDKSVTIYLNRQTRTVVAGKPTSVTVNAIAVEFSKAVQSQALGADIAIGTATAN